MVFVCRPLEVRAHGKLLSLCLAVQPADDGHSNTRQRRRDHMFSRSDFPLLHLESPRKQCQSKRQREECHHERYFSRSRYTLSPIPSVLQSGLLHVSVGYEEQHQRFIVDYKLLLEAQPKADSSSSQCTQSVDLHHGNLLSAV